MPLALWTSMLPFWAAVGATAGSVAAAPSCTPLMMTWALAAVFRSLRLMFDALICNWAKGWTRTLVLLPRDVALLATTWPSLTVSSAVLVGLAPSTWKTPAPFLMIGRSVP